MLYIHSKVKPTLTRSVHYYDIIKNQGLPSVDAIVNFATKYKHTILVLDDCIEVLSNLSSTQERSYETLVTDVSRKVGMSLIFISQFIFLPRLNFLLTFRQAATSFTLFPLPGNAKAINLLGSQIAPNHKQAYLDAFNDATSRSYGYLHCHLKTPGDGLVQLKLRNYLAAPSEKYLKQLPQDLAVWRMDGQNFHYPLEKGQTPILTPAMEDEQRQQQQAINVPDEDLEQQQQQQQQQQQPKATNPRSVRSVLQDNYMTSNLSN